MTSRTQEERSRSTRQRLLEATIECIAEHGWSGTTTTVVASRAGVSRGAQLHHYPTRAELVIAAVEYLAEKRVAAIGAEAAALPRGRARTAAVLEMLTGFYTGPLFVAALEMWVAARTDPDLRAALVPLETRLGREAHRLTAELLGVDGAAPGVREAVQATLDLMRGLGLADVLTDDSARRARLLEHWAGVLDDLVGGRP